MRFAIVAAAVLAFAGAAAAQTTRKVPQDYDTIQEAENDCDDGDTILIAKGRYYESVTLDVPNVKVIGNGVVWDGNIDGTDGDCIYINATGCTVQGITFRNGTYQVDVNNAPATVTKCTFIDAVQDGVYFDGGSDATVTSCKFRGEDSNAIASYADETIISKCTVRGTSAQGFFCNGDDFRAENNTLLYAYSGGIRVSGADAVASKNKITATGNRGIWISGVNAVVSGNTLNRITWGHAVYIEGANGLVEKTKSTANEGGIYVAGDGLRILGNKVSEVNEEESGIEGVGDDMEVVGNSVTLGAADAWGYYLYSATATGGGLIENNKASDFMDEGAYLTPIYNCSVNNFAVLRCGSYDTKGIEISGDANDLTKLAAIDCENDGIALNDADAVGNIFTNCVVKDCTGNGFLVYGTGNEFVNCSASNCGEGFDNRGTNTEVTGGKYRGDRFDITNTGGTFSGGLGSVDFVTGGSTQASEVD